MKLRRAKKQFWWTWGYHPDYESDRQWGPGWIYEGWTMARIKHQIKR